MINKIFYYLQRPEKGWDPIPKDYAKKYAHHCYTEENVAKCLADVQSFVGSLKGMNVLDLGAGPGQFTAAFAKEGADVTWHDISRHYLNLCRSQYPDIDLKFKIGYLEEATGQYDLVFNRLSWYYSLDDCKFLQHVIELIKEGGYGYFVIPRGDSSEHLRLQKLTFKKTLNILRFYLNDLFGVKIGHPFISKKRLQKLFSVADLNYISFHEVGRNILVKIIK